MRPRRSRSKQRGSTLLITFTLATLLAVGAVAYVNRATQTVREQRRQAFEVQTTHLCEAGVQSVLRSLWRPFKISQRFDDIDDRCATASANNPNVNLGGTIPGVGKWAAGVISKIVPNGDTYTRLIQVRAVGWVDFNDNGSVDPGEPQKVVDVTATYTLARSQVFDYTYFVNNYGWMSGFNQNDLIVNGDMRANGNFDFTSGSPTVNGSIIACVNDKLTPPAAGVVNTLPVKWPNSTYQSANANNPRVRQAYSSAVHGTKGSDQYELWRDFVFEGSASVVNNRLDGANASDSSGSRSWTRTSQGISATSSLIDSSPTEEVIMPDLSDLSYYQNLSVNYRDPKLKYEDGTNNPYFNQPAYVEIWDQTLNNGNGAYKRITTNGVVSGSAILIGTATKPVRIHGPVTFTQDCVIKGYVSGQGTIYTGRNVHVVGSIRYTNPPDFRGSNQAVIDNANEKKDMLALAARASVIMGNPKDFTDAYPLQYMTPPFTKGRYDESGNWIPPYNAKEIDSSGKKKYQSVLGDAALDAIDESVNQIDAILYTNFVGGGDIGTGGGGVNFNGTIISKDEAMVIFSLPMTMNYDNRIRERSLSKTPLIDLQLPRSPVMLRSSWQDRGFSYRG